MSDHLDLLDYRRIVGNLYRDIRQTEERDYVAAVAAFRRAKDELYAHHPQSPLDQAQRARFQPLRYYPVDPALRLVVPMVPDSEGTAIMLPTSDDETMRARRIGYVHFAVGGVPARLAVYWLVGYAGGLFVPFRDATAGHTTYGGGRYLWDSVKGADPGSDAARGEIVLDFNLAYNPSCAYNPKWSCPLAPSDSRLPLPIQAGEQAYVEDEGKERL